MPTTHPMKPAPTGYQEQEFTETFMDPEGVMLVHRVMALLHGDSPITHDNRRDLANMLSLAIQQHTWKENA